MSEETVKKFESRITSLEETIRQLAKDVADNPSTIGQQGEGILDERWRERYWWLK